MSKIMNLMSKPMMTAVSKLTPSCKEVTRKISESLDRPLTFKEKMGVRIHLLGCVLCTRYQKQMMALNNIFRSYSHAVEQEELPGRAELRPEVRERIRKVIGVQH